MSEEKPKFNFSKHRLPKANRIYLVKFSIYGTILVILILLLYFKKNNAQKKKKSEPRIELIHE